MSTTRSAASSVATTSAGTAVPSESDYDAGGCCADPLVAQRSRQPEAEEHVREEVEHRPPDDGDELGRRQLLRGMRDHELVPHRGDDHPGDEDDVEVREPVACHRRAIGGELEPPLCDARHVAEVEPPERGARDEREPERGHASRTERQIRRRRSGDHDRLAERDDDEELEPLREVRGLDLPRGRVEARPAREPSRGRAARRSRSRARRARARSASARTRARRRSRRRPPRRTR